MGNKVAAVVSGVASIWTAAAGAQPADRRAEEFCSDLHRLVESAEQDRGFAWLERARGTPPYLGFPGGGCRANDDERRQYWLCSQQFAPESRSAEALAARVAACLPEAKREAGTRRREARFTLPSARIHITETGGPGAHVGRIVELVVEAVPDPPD